MSLYPKWLLLLSGLNLLSLLLAVFFLFGEVTPFGTSENSFVRFLYYIGTQLLWIVPIACFFGALRAHDYQHPRLAVVVALLGLIVLVTSLFLLL